MKAKTALAVVAVVVYVVCPAYRYWIIGTWMGNKILTDNGKPIRSIAKGSKAYERLVKI